MSGQQKCKNYPFDRLIALNRDPPPSSFVIARIPLSRYAALFDPGRPSEGAAKGLRNKLASSNLPGGWFFSGSRAFSFLA